MPAQRAVTGDFASMMNAKRLIIEPNRPVDCLVIGRSPVAKLAADGPVTAALIRLSLRSLINYYLSGNSA